MSEIIVPQGIDREFLSADQTVEVRDASGHLLGLFVPSLSSDYATVDPQIDEAELQRGFAAGGGRPLSEILADLKKQQG